MQRYCTDLEEGADVYSSGSSRPCMRTTLGRRHGSERTTCKRWEDERAQNFDSSILRSMRAPFSCWSGRIRLQIDDSHPQLHR
jgi:hypothetical protein